MLTREDFQKELAGIEKETAEVRRVMENYPGRRDDAVILLLNQRIEMNDWTANKIREQVQNPTVLKVPTARR